MVIDSHTKKGDISDIAGTPPMPIWAVPTVVSFDVGEASKKWTKILVENCSHRDSVGSPK